MRAVSPAANIPADTYFEAATPHFYNDRSIKFKIIKTLLDGALPGFDIRRKMGFDPRGEDSKVFGPRGSKVGVLEDCSVKGITVGSPVISNSYSARPAFSGASWRSEPVIINFAKRESNAPVMTSPVVIPGSTRTPGLPRRRSE